MRRASQPAGAVIGPMVVAGALIKEGEMNHVEGLGVKDSKDLTIEKRDELYGQLEDVLDDFVILKVSAAEIDHLRERKNLNKIEAEKMAEIIDTLKPARAIIDSPEANTRNFRDYLFTLVEDQEMEIVAENKADEKYPICSAASILAKVVRDQEIDKLKERTGVDFGVGYPHDERTIDFLKQLLEDNGDFPDYVRHSWITADNLKKEGKQKGLDDY